METARIDWLPKITKLEKVAKVRSKEWCRSTESVSDFQIQYRFGRFWWTFSTFSVSLRLLLSLIAMTAITNTVTNLNAKFLSILFHWTKFFGAFIGASMIILVTFAKTKAEREALIKSWSQKLSPCWLAL